MSKTNELLTQIYTTKLRLKSALGTSSDDICSYPTLIYNFFVNIWNNNYPTGYDNGYTEAYQVIAGTAPTQEHTLIERRSLKEYTSNIPTVVDDRDRAFILNLESIMIQVKESRLEMKDELFTTSDDFTIYPDLLNYLILHADVFERMGYDDGWNEACESLSTNRPSSPTISFSDNTITLSGSGTIMYSLNGDDFVSYTNPIQIDEDTYIIAYSVVNNIPSESVSSWCKYEDDTPIPAPLSPNIYFSNNTITISSTEVGGIIKYSFDGENYSTYNSPISITEDRTVYAYVVKDGVSSDIASRFCEYNSSGGGQGGGGSEEDNVPAPTIIFSNNTITIYNNAGGGKTYYYFTPSDISEYTSSISISSSVTVYAYTIKNNVMSNTVSQYCEYNAGGGGGGTVTVASPSIGFSNNTITITNNEAGASVYYSFDGITYSPYTSPISISSTVTAYAYASKNGVNSSVVNRNCTYDGPVYVPSAPVISFSDNIITITTNESGAVIKYSYDGVNYSTYTSPIVISEVKHVYAKVTKDGVDSSVVDRICDPDHEYDNDYLTIRMLENGNIAWTSRAPQYEDEEIEYSKNNGTWYTLHANTVGISVERGDVIRFKHYNSTYSTVGCKFSISSLFDVEGNVLSLVNGDNGTYTSLSCGELFKDTSVHSARNLILPAVPELRGGIYQRMFMNCTSLVDAPTLHDSVSVLCYSQMFYGCTALTTAPALPATTLAVNCYYQMFYGCRSLTTAPSLPATTLKNACYEEMFRGCTSLTTAPTLPATTISGACYQGMFYGCTSLRTAPALPATSLANQCYTQMFQYCTALTTAPALPATTLANQCYTLMFFECTSLTTAPELSATTLKNACYDRMFANCTSLRTAPVLPATTLAIECYSSMFLGCTSLTTAPALPATSLADDCYSGMFYDCTSLTTAPILRATTLAVRCYQGMFYGCTSLTIAPALPATTLTYQCYHGMFSGCTSLRTAPELPATTLVGHCYTEMFFGCTRLNYIKCLATNISASECTLRWANGVASTGTFIKNTSMTGWTTGNNGIPSGWTVQDAVV